jgi:hypothetical protein
MVSLPTIATVSVLKTQPNGTFKNICLSNNIKFLVEVYGDYDVAYNPI